MSPVPDTTSVSALALASPEITGEISGHTPALSGGPSPKVARQRLDQTATDAARERREAAAAARPAEFTIKHARYGV